MGDAAVSALVKDVLQRLTSMAIIEFRLLRRLGDDLLALEGDFNQIQAVVEDAEEKRNVKAVELWLQSLKSVTLKMENVLDDVSTKVMLQRLYKELGIKYRVRDLFSSDHNQLMYRTRMAHKVKTIRKQLDDIAARKTKLNLTPGTTSSSVDEGVCGDMPNRETSSLMHDSSFIFGRNEELEMVTEKLCNPNIGKNDVDEIRVYAIWGMGGLGKTTLAQLVYNHERVNEYFELKCWIYVSEKFLVKELIKGIIESIDKSQCTLSQLDGLQESLQSRLKGRRFIIILDDVWIEENEKMKWDQLSQTLSCGADGSIVVMTTRSKTCSRMMAKLPELQHELGCLSEEDAWSLFEKLAFAEGRDQGGYRSELEPIGEKIVEKCKGLPLAVKTLGGLMWSKSSKSDWESVNSSNLWELQENNIVPALKLSYDNLLPHLKRCFAYCGLFTKGDKMKKDVLIDLWVSNGFIPPRGEINLYVLGEEVFNCLLWNSFFQAVKHLDDEYIIHDLMHDIARYVIRHDCSVIKPGKELIIPDEVIHLSSSCPDFLFSTKDLGKLTSLRSIFMFNLRYESNISQILNLVYLRVLYLVGIRLTRLPESICRLKHMRYLNLSRSPIQVLPESIIYLQNLIVLLLDSCMELHKLPKGMRHMRNLQKLGIFLCTSLWHLPIGIKELTSLRRLSKFPLGNKKGAQIGELGDLNLLEGELDISGVENVGGLSEAKSANLKHKTNLLSLRLEWELFRESKPEIVAQDDEVLQGFEPNPDLKKLIIRGFMGNTLDGEFNEFG